MSCTRFRGEEQAGVDSSAVVRRRERQATPYLQTEFDEQHGRFSPDGKWVAYTSNESGRQEVYVQSFPVSGAKFQISSGGGREPHWRKDGTELFYIGEDRTLTAVPVKLGGSASEPFQAGQAKPLFPLSRRTRVHHRTQL